MAYLKYNYDIITSCRQYLQTFPAGIYSNVNHMNQKPLFLAVALTALLVIGGVFWIMQKRPVAPNQPVTPDPIVEIPVQAEPETPIDTSGWKTYRNEELGFEVRLPKNFEKTEQGFTPLNPLVGNPESLENNVWFEVGEKKSEFWKSLYGKSIESVPNDDFLYPFEKKARDSGAIEVNFERKKVNDISLVIVSSILKKEPNYDTGGGWIEGAWDKEAFFRCNKAICSVVIHSHAYSKEKEALFSTVIKTLRY